MEDCADCRRAEVAPGATARVRDGAPWRVWTFACLGLKPRFANAVDTSSHVLNTKMVSSPGKRTWKVARTPGAVELRELCREGAGRSCPPAVRARDAAVLTRDAGREGDRLTQLMAVCKRLDRGRTPCMASSPGKGLFSFHGERALVRRSSGVCGSDLPSMSDVHFPVCTTCMSASLAVCAHAHVPASTLLRHLLVQLLLSVIWQKERCPIAPRCLRPHIGRHH